MSIKIDTKAPKLDERKYKEIAAQALQLAQYYFSAPQWDGVDWKSIKQGTLNTDDPAYRLLDIFARLMELLVGRLNQIPVKNFLSFLDMVGVEQKVGNPAEVPVTFLPAKSAGTGGQIPAGTQVATTQTDTADAQVFETRSAFYAVSAKLMEAVNVIPEYDTYSRLALVGLPPEEPADVDNETGRITAFKEDDGALEDIEHVLYLESEYLFGGEEPVKLALAISVDSDWKEVFDPNYLSWKRYIEEDEEWQEIDNADITYDLHPGSEPVEVFIDNFEGTAQSEVNGVEGYWLACHFTGDFADIGEMSVFTEVSGSITTPDAAGSTAFTTKIETAFVNSTAVDPSKPVYPFGQRPQYGDAFYIGSIEAFAPNVDYVTLTFTILPYSDSDIERLYRNLEDASSISTVTVTTNIDWEYLDANGEWQLLNSFLHTLSVQYNPASSTFTITRTASAGHENGTLFGNGTATSFGLNFPGFADIGLNKVNKEESCWLRAVVKSRDAYGKDAWIEDAAGDNQPFTVIGPTFMPPIIENIQVTYTYKTDLEPVNAIQTKNNFHYTVHAEGAQPPETPFTPFIPITSFSVGSNSSFIDSKPALYLGFDKAFGDVYISMFFDIAETLSDTGYALEQGNPHLNWEYAASDDTWKPLDVEDGTANLTGSGTVAFTGPVDSRKVTLFKSLMQEEGSEIEELHWYRVRLAKGYFDHAPLIRGVYLNTVMADNRVVSKEDQVVGSGKGTAGQTVSLVRTPVTGGELWIREAEAPGEEELQTLLQDFRTLSESEEAKDMEEADLVEEIEKSGGQTEHRVRWLKVPNFLSSGPRSRHYTLDAVNGKIVFGDGKEGLIPPAGKDNMIIRNYRTGGGEAANKAASPLAVKELKSSLPYIDKVFNVQNAVGGSDPWSMEQTMAFGPQSVKNRNRAVTMEDFQWMVLQQFSQVARARCIPTSIPAENGSLSFQPGAATIIIVPNSTAVKPQPSRALLRRIGDYLKEKALGTILENVHVIGPGFEEISITAVVKPLLPEESSIVERRIISSLEAFFHPLTGGESGEGWEFGRNVYISEVYAVIESTEGVDYVISAAFTGKPAEDYIEVGDNSLGYSGTHDITMESS